MFSDQILSVNINTQTNNKLNEGPVGYDNVNGAALNIDNNLSNTDNKKSAIIAKTKDLYQRQKKWFIILISFCAVYDVIGDILYLSSFDVTDDVGVNNDAHTLMLNTYRFTDNSDHWPISCDSAPQGFYCEPFDPEPKTYSASSLWEKYNNRTQYCGPQQTIGAYKSAKVVGGLCSDAASDEVISLNGDSLIVAAYRCLTNICDRCPNAPILVFDSGQVVYSCPDIAFDDDIVDASHHGWITCCDEWTATATATATETATETTMAIVASALLIIISIKETLKMLFNLSYFISKQCQQEYMLRFSINSVISWFLMLVSDRFCDDALAATDSKNRTLGLFTDLLLEDIPQIILPLYVVVEYDQNPAIITLISLSGSLIMLIVHIVVLGMSIWTDFNEVKVLKPISNEIEMRKVDYHDNEVDRWLSKQVGLPQYCHIFRDNGFEQIKWIKTISDDDLQRIGVHLIGHRRAILDAAQQIDR
eukprot:453085_1